MNDENPSVSIDAYCPMCSSDTSIPTPDNVSPGGEFNFVCKTCQTWWSVEFRYEEVERNESK